MRDKLIRLQKLYIEQFGRLQHKLRESRRNYLVQVSNRPNHNNDIQIKRQERNAKQA